FWGSSRSVSLSPREEMSQAGPFSRDLFLDTFLHEHGPEALEVPGMTDLTESSPHSDNPDYVAMRLAFIGDEMEVRWTLPHIAELPGVAVYSLAFTYNQTGLRGVLRSFMDGLTNLRENIRFWSLLTRRDRAPCHRRLQFCIPFLTRLLFAAPLAHLWLLSVSMEQWAQEVSPGRRRGLALPMLLLLLLLLLLGWGRHLLQ
ncbi:hypothetical protein HPG69_006302, partial [Diceros bicornis minor]